MRTLVKICGITNVKDALLACKAGADAIGLVFYNGSPRAIGLEAARDLIRALPPFVTSVGLFVNPKIEEVYEAIKKVKIDTIQFHGSELPSFCEQFNHPYIKAVGVNDSIDLVQYASKYKFSRGLLLDYDCEENFGGTGKSFNWGLIPSKLPFPFVLAGGLGPENVAMAIQKTSPWAVDVSSGVEKEKGIKDFSKMVAFVKGVRDADV